MLANCISIFATFEHRHTYIISVPCLAGKRMQSLKISPWWKICRLQAMPIARLPIANPETDRGDHTQPHDSYCIIYLIAIVQHIMYTCANPNRGPHILTQHATDHKKGQSLYSGKLGVGLMVGSVLKRACVVCGRYWGQILG